jgi:flagella basal body P-ring formation protein FlgA
MFIKFSSPTRPPHKVLGLVVSLCFALGAAAQAHAQANGETPEFIETTQRWLDNAVSNVRPSEGSPLRMEVAVGRLDSRLQLAPCARIEPYIPVGTRLWGKTRLGLRCLEGSAKWNVFLPVTIKAYGVAWVIKGNVPRGAVLTEADAIEAEVDWAEEASPVVSNATQWIGQVASRALTTGQALRQGMTQAAQVFQAGTQVRVVAQGAGFEITSDGQALSAGYVGQTARVRMDGGRVMTGVVLDSRTVRLEI